MKRHDNASLPLWARLVYFAEDHADDDGNVYLGVWELRRALDPLMFVNQSQISRAIRTAERKGLLDRCSTSRHLKLVHNRVR